MPRGNAFTAEEAKRIADVIDTEVQENVKQGSVNIDELSGLLTIRTKALAIASKQVGTKAKVTPIGNGTSKRGKIQLPSIASTAATPSNVSDEAGA